MATNTNGLPRSATNADNASLKKPEISSLGVENGSDFSLAFSTPFNPTQFGVSKTGDEQLQEVLNYDVDGAGGPTVRQLTIMRRQDGQARALYRLMTLPIRSSLATAKFVAAQGDNGECDFVQQALTTAPSAGGMTVTWHRFIAQVLQGLFDGFAAFEKVWWIPASGPLKGKITLKKLAYRPSETVSFVADQHGGFAGFRQRTTVAGRYIDAYIPPENAFYYSAQEEERKFYGVSFFESAFFHYDAKVKLYFTAFLAAQRAAVGTRVGTIPDNASTAAKNEFSRQLANLSFAQYMMMPEEFKVEVLGEKGSFDFLSMINLQNSQMSKSVLAAFFDENQGGGSGDNAIVQFAQPGDDMFVLMLQAIMDDIANQINHYIIPQLVDFNFDSKNYPTFSWGKLTNEQKQSVANTFKLLVNIAPQSQGVTPEFMRALEQSMADEMGLDIDYAEVDKREAAQQAAGSVPGSVPGMGAPNGANPGTPQVAAQASASSDESEGETDPDAAVSDFEKQALAAAGNGGSSDTASLSAQEDKFISLAQDFLDRARGD